MALSYKHKTVFNCFNDEQHRMKIYNVIRKLRENTSTDTGGIFFSLPLGTISVACPWHYRAMLHHLSWGNFRVLEHLRVNCFPLANEVIQCVPLTKWSFGTNLSCSMLYTRLNCWQHRLTSFYWRWKTTFNVWKTHQSWTLQQYTLIFSETIKPIVWQKITFWTVLKYKVSAKLTQICFNVDEALDAELLQPKIVYENFFFSRQKVQSVCFFLKYGVW